MNEQKVYVTNTNECDVSGAPTITNDHFCLFFITEKVSLAF